MTKNLAILSKGKCSIFAQFLINDSNEQYKDRMRSFCESLGVPSKSICFRPMIQNFRNAQTEVIEGRCHEPYAGAYFNSDGYLLPCCTNVGDDLKLDHVSTFHTPEELRNNDRVRAMRKSLARNKNRYASCVSCPGAQVHRSLYDSVKRRAAALIS